MSTATDTIDVADLHAWAAGDLRMMAALQLLDASNLIAHDWIGRFIKTDPWLHFDFEAMKLGLARSPLASGEQAIAEAVLSLVGQVDIDLGGTALSLDQANLTVLCEAIALAGGKGGRS
ncbi:hypothetical protein [Glycomyces salinus]|uniref:hypothetical protein n=1 Tax=Glycomyces salinus TaxID=980294 RepID=UPI0018EC8220|nr:hypothetical protein [Glycomyces salinus]